MNEPTKQEARITALKQVINHTSDDFSAISYAKMAGLDVNEIFNIRKEWIKELRQLEGLTIDEIKADAIEETKELLAVALKKPIRFNGKFYSITMEKQNLLAAQLGLYGLNAQAGIPTELSWNATGESCTPWAFEELLTLSNTIAAYIKPFAQKQRDAEVEIKSCSTKTKVEKVIAKYKADLSATVN